MLTTTKCEIECMGCDLTKKYRLLVHDLVRQGDLGIKLDWQPADELGIAIDCFGYWEQEKFTYLNNVNYLNDYDIRNIYKRARDL